MNQEDPGTTRSLDQEVVVVGITRSLHQMILTKMELSRKEAPQRDRKGHRCRPSERRLHSTSYRKIEIRSALLQIYQYTTSRMDPFN